MVAAGLLQGDRVNQTTVPSEIIANANVNTLATANLNKRLLKINTGLVYKQQKYNLLSEESEGYAKLYHILHAFPAPGAGADGQGTGSRCAQAITSVLSTTGQFDLDPNRVLDIVMDVFMTGNCWNAHFVPLLRCFKKDNMAHILGNKFLMACGQFDVGSAGAGGGGSASTPKAPGNKPARGTKVPAIEAPATPAPVAPPSASASATMPLYKLAALLLKEGFVEFSALKPYLTCAPLGGASTATASSEALALSTGTTPDPAPDMVGSMLDAVDRAIAGVGKKARSFGQISLGGPAKADKSDSAARAPGLSPATGRGGGSSSGSASARVDRPEVPLPEVFIEAQAAAHTPSPSTAWESFAGGNQLFGLLCGLLAVDAWDLAWKLVLEPTSALVVQAPTKHFSNKNSKQLLLTDLVGYCKDIRESLSEMLYRVSEHYVAVIGNIPEDGCAAHAAIRAKLHRRQLAPNDRASSYTVHGAVSSTGCALGSIQAYSRREAKRLYDTAGAAVGGEPICEAPYGGGSKLPAWFVPEGGTAKVVEGAADAPVWELLLLGLPESKFFAVLSLLSFHVGSHSVLFTRVLKILFCYVKLAVSRGGASTVPPAVLNYISGSLLPGLVLGGCNPSAATALWDILSLLPFHLRYRCYDAWKAVSSAAGPAKGPFSNSKAPKQPSAAAVALEEARSLHGAKQQLKRLTKDNVKQIGRQLAKHTHQCPLTVFGHLLTQIESYENLIPFVVESLKYTTELTRDCLGYSLVLALQKDQEGGGGSAKVKPGDTHAAQWFASLTKFIGSFYRKFPGTELKGLLHYLLNRLAPSPSSGLAGDCVDLLVLKELLNKMGGCETTLEISRSQLSDGGLTGGKLLRTEIMGASSSVGAGGAAGGKVAVLALGVGRETVSKRAVRVLREELLSSGTAIPLLLFIAQYRSRLAYQEEGEAEDDGGRKQSLKLVSHLFDGCQDVLMQYTEFLMQAFTVPGSSDKATVGDGADTGRRGDEHDIAALMPPLQSLLVDYGLSVPVAFQLVRPLLRAALLRHCAATAEDQAAMELEGGSGQSDRVRANAFVQRWNPLGAELLQVIREHCAGQSPHIWDDMSPELFMIFWTFNNSDLCVPTARYEAEIGKLAGKLASLEAQLKSQNDAVSNNKILAAASSMMGGKHGGGMSAADLETAKSNIKVLRQEVKRLSGSIADLRAEQHLQTANTRLTLDLIAQHQESFFAHVAAGDKTDIPTAIVQHLVYDRMLMSPLDATYCSQFFMHLHQTGTRGFNTVQFVDSVVHTVTPLVFATTDYEAAFAGFLLADVLSYANRWVYGASYGSDGSAASARAVASGDSLAQVDESEYLAEVARCPEAFLPFPTAPTPEAETEENKKSQVDADADADADAVEMDVVEPIDGDEKTHPLSHNQIKTVYLEWHRKITSVVLAGLRRSNKEYLYRRCTLVMLSKMATGASAASPSYFPALTDHGGAEIMARVLALDEEEKQAGRPDLQMMAKGLSALMRKVSTKWVGYVAPRASTPPPPPEAAGAAPLGGAVSIGTAGVKRPHGAMSAAALSSQLFNSQNAVRQSRGAGGKEAGEEDDGGIDEPAPAAKLSAPTTGGKGSQGKNQGKNQGKGVQGQVQVQGKNSQGQGKPGPSTRDARDMRDVRDRDSHRNAPGGSGRLPPDVRDVRDRDRDRRSDPRDLRDVRDVRDNRDPRDIRDNRDRDRDYRASTVRTPAGGGPSSSSGPGSGHNSGSGPGSAGKGHQGQGHQARDNRDGRDGRDGPRGDRSTGGAGTGGGAKSAGGAPNDRGQGQGRGQIQGQGQGSGRGQGQSQGKPPDQGKSQGQSQGKTPDKGQSQGQSQGKTPDQSKSQGQSQGKTPDQSKSQGQSQGKPPDQGQSQGQSQGKKPDQSKSQGQSQGKPPDQSQSQGKMSEEERLRQVLVAGMRRGKGRGNQKTGSDYSGGNNGGSGGSSGNSGGDTGSGTSAGSKRSLDGDSVGGRDGQREPKKRRHK